MAPNVTLHFFGNNDLNGDVLATITDEDEIFRGLTLKLERDGLGGAQLELSRDAALQGYIGDGGFAAEAFVRVLVHAYSDTVYFPWGFFFNKRQATVIHKNERGAETYLFGGAGPKMYLDRAILGIGSPSTGWALDLINGVWRWNEDASVGKILNRIVTQDSNEDDPALPDLTLTFDASDDSASVAWADTDLSGSENDLYEIPIGTSLLTSLFDLDDLVELTSWIDLGTVASPKFELNVIQGLGEDKTGGTFGAGVCLLKEGVNIANDSLTLEGQSLKRASHVVVEGKNGKWAEAVRTSFDPGEYVKRAKIEYTRSGSVFWLEKAGLRWLRRQDFGEKELELEILPGASDATGLYFPAPDRNLWLSNLVSVDTSANGTTNTPLDIAPSEDQLVTGIDMELGVAGDTTDATAKARSWNIKVKLNKERAGNVRRSPDQSSAGNGKDGCSCHNPPRFPPECLPDPGPTVLITWDWTACSDPSYTDPFDASSGNPWGGGYAEEGPWGSNGCGTRTDNNDFSKKIAVTPGTTIKLTIRSGKYGAGAPTTMNMQARFFTSGGAIVNTLEEVMATGVTSNNHGGYANWVTDEAEFLVPATSAYVSFAQGTWSNHNTQYVQVTIPGPDPIQVEDCFDYGEFEHGSSYTLPSDYLQQRFEALEQGLAQLDLDGLFDVDASAPTDGQVLTWDSATSTWVAESPGGPSGAAGGDLSGTYPNPSVVNDSHTHTGSTLSINAAGELLIVDTGASTPLIFADILQNEAQDDLLYADL